MSCGEPGGSACGGAGVLSPPLGSACGVCEDGATICADGENTRCAGATELNACGGCGFLPWAPGTACGPAGTWTCVDTELTCTPTPGGNACGGLSDLPAAPGTPCGTCDAGRRRCDGNDSLLCAGGEETPFLAFADSDGHGFGDESAGATLQCALQTGFVRTGGDCNDCDAAVSPDAAELCDGADNDCDGLADQQAIDAPRWYRDSDGDGDGDPTHAQRACAQPAGWVATDDDCDDTDAARHPLASESDCTDPIDYNCDGVTEFMDADRDGYAACIDCDDDDPLRYPGRVEVCDGTAGGAPPWSDGEPGLLAADRCALALAAPSAPGELAGWAAGACERRVAAFVCQRPWSGACVLGADETCGPTETCVLDTASLQTACVGAVAPSRFGQPIVAVVADAFVLELMEPQEWTTARQECVEWGGELTHPRTSAQQADVEEFIARQGATAAAWIGLRNSSADDTFVWTSGAAGTPDESFWAPGEPGAEGRDAMLELRVSGLLATPPESNVAESFAGFTTLAHTARDGFVCERRFR